MKHYILSIICLFIWACASADCYAQKPKWIDNTPQELNYTYKFLEVVSTGSSIELARHNAKETLEDDTQLQEGIRVYRRTKDNTTIDKNRANGGKLLETKQQHIEIETTVDGEQYQLQAVKVDEYSSSDNGIVTLHTLYMVALCDDPVFDRTYLTTSYGTMPAAMSIIPGLGQWYKGSKIKGISLFAAEAAAVAGIIACENQKASYINKANEQPKFAKEYSSKADNWETGRNVCIGVAAGIWVYNMVDAIVAKGARHVVVKRADGGGLAMAPFAMPNGGAGVSFAYKF
ncbi:MAG: hypothetical protein KBT20_11485 [Bacteroidales bacterium]|nr:hypothetical protein [Candidatus Liminaster caballi]